MYNYIPHPSNFSKSTMITSLLIEEGHAAYGVYWMILELLRDNPHYRIGNNPKAIAWAIHCKDVNLVGRVCYNYGLFDQDENGLLYSPWLISQMASYDAKKRRLQEAGRRGAAKRFSKSNNGEAIATPSDGDGEAIAILPNITQYNITQDNITPPTEGESVDVDDILRSPGATVTPELIDALQASASPGRAPGYLAQLCVQYGMGERVLQAMLSLTDGATITNKRYEALCVKVRDIQAKSWKPTLPANFFLRLLTKN